MDNDVFADLTGICTAPKPMRQRSAAEVSRALPTPASQKLAFAVFTSRRGPDVRSRHSEPDPQAKRHGVPTYPTACTAALNPSVADAGPAGSSARQKSPQASAPPSQIHGLEDLADLSQPRRNSGSKNTNSQLDGFAMFGDLAPMTPPVATPPCAPPVATTATSTRLETPQATRRPSAPAQRLQGSSPADEGAPPSYDDIMQATSVMSPNAPSSTSSSEALHIPTVSIYFLDDPNLSLPSHATSNGSSPHGGSPLRLARKASAHASSDAQVEPRRRRNADPSASVTPEAAIGGAQHVADSECGCLLAAPQPDLLGTNACSEVEGDKAGYPTAAEAEAEEGTEAQFFDVSDNAVAAPEAALSPSAAQDTFDVLGVCGEDSRAAVACGECRMPAAPSQGYDLLGGGGAGAATAGGDGFGATMDVDALDDFFQAGATSAPSTAAGAADAGNVFGVAERPAAPTSGGHLIRGVAPQEGHGRPEEPGNDFLTRMVAEAEAVCAMLPPDRARKVIAAIASVHEYVATRMVEKGKVANVTEAGLHYARLNASRTAGQMLSKSVQYHSREAQHEQDLADASEYKDEIKASIKAWAYQGGQRKQLRNLLVDLGKVLWEGAVWKCKGLQDVSSDKDVKKWLNKARLLLHTDKMSGQPERVRLRAELILVEIDKALKGIM